LFFGPLVFFLPTSTVGAAVEAAYANVVELKGAALFVGPLFFFLPTRIVGGAVEDTDEREGKESSYDTPFKLGGVGSFSASFLGGVELVVMVEVGGDVDDSRYGRQASRIAFSITIDACSRLGQIIFAPTPVSDLLPSSFFAGSPDSQPISASTRASESTTVVMVSSDWNCLQGQSTHRARLLDFFLGVTTIGVPVPDMMLHRAAQTINH